MGDPTSSHSKREQPTGWRVALATLIPAAMIAAYGSIGIWNAYRELYCRHFHESAQMLCHFFDWDFRGDAVVVFLASLVAYTMFHLVVLRTVKLRWHLIVVCGLFVAVGLSRLLIFLIPGKWEAWY